MNGSTYRMLLAAGFAALAGSTVAAVLPANGSLVELPGTSAAAQPQLAGTVVRDVVAPFTLHISDDFCGESCDFSYDLTGELQSRVVKAVDGTYDFYWRIATQPIPSRIRNSRDGRQMEPTPPGFTADLSWATLSGFVAPQYRAGWRNDGAASLAKVLRRPGDSSPSNRRAVRPCTRRRTFGSIGAHRTLLRTVPHYGDGKVVSDQDARVKVVVALALAKGVQVDTPLRVARKRMAPLRVAQGSKLQAMPVSSVRAGRAGARW